MARSYIPSQAAMAGHLHDPPSIQMNQRLEPAQFSPASFFCGGKYPDFVALWHSPTPVQVQRPGALTDSTNGPSSGSGSSVRQLQTTTGQKKHRRTRTGCYTCRSRRVKCDETLPVCDRCRKGNRNCVYPLPGVASSKPGTNSSSKFQSSTRPPSYGSDGSDQADVDDTGARKNALDVEDGAGTSMSKPGLSETRNSRSATGAKRKRQQQPSETTVTRTEASASPTTTESSAFDSMSSRSASVGVSHPVSKSVDVPDNTRSLPDDVRFYLNFHRQFVTHHHYWLKSTGDKFVNRVMIDFALQYEPLLYAMVGFSAYLHSLHSPGGRLYTFLKYYHRALILLRKSLGSGQKHSEATLITILVLTTFEEYIGDWVSLIDHHQAAHALVCELYTPETMASDYTGREIFAWYARFDVVAGMLAGSETILNREWYIVREEYDAVQAVGHPNSTEKQILFACSVNRRLGLDVASLYAKLDRGMISMEEFTVQNDQLFQTLEILRSILRRCSQPEYTVPSLPQNVPPTNDDVVDPYVPGILHCGPLWDLNFAWIDILSNSLMLKYQSCLVIQQQSSPSELESLALEQCRLIEAIVRWPEKKNGYFLSFKNSLSLSSIFIPRDEKYLMWCRRKLAQLDHNGYISSSRFRAGLAAVWQIPEVTHWWLPNDEGYFNIIRETRAMSEERMNKPRDNFRENVRNMKTIFWKLGLDDTENDPDSSGT